jgi:TPR repeat protein
MSSARVATPLAVVLGATLGTGAALVRGPVSSYERGASLPLDSAATIAEPVPAKQTRALLPAPLPAAPPASSEPPAREPPLREQPLEPTESAVLAAALNCARGEPDDCLRTSEAYEAGRGVKTSPGQARDFRASAIKRYSEDCTARDPDACHALATLRATGRGLAQSVEAAEVLMERARQACRTRPAPICDKLR